MRNAIYNKPITVVALILSIQTLLYGIGFSLATQGFQRTVLWESVGENLFNPRYMGLVYLATGLGMLYAVFKEKPTWVQRVFEVNAFVWLFSFCLYLVNGFPTLGVAIAGTFALLSGYVGFAFRVLHKR